MSLIDELQQMASAPGASVCDLLRKAKVVAVKLKQTETAGWIDSELSGNFEEYPEYRKVPVKLMQRNPFFGMQPLTFADVGFNTTVNEARPLPRPIKEIEEMANGTEGALFITIPPNIVGVLLELGADTPEVFHMTPRTAVSGVVDAVRTRVLDWALALEQNGIHGEGMSFSSDEQQEAQGITIHFNGTTNFAGVIGKSQGIGASGVEQQQKVYGAALGIAERLKASAKALSESEAGLLNEAAEAIDEAAKAQKPRSLSRGLRWAKAALTNVAAFAAKEALHEIDSVLDRVPL